MVRELEGGVQLRDVRFHSAALGRDEVYRVVRPMTLAPGRRLHVVYLLHGNGGEYRDWQENAPLAAYAGRGYLFVMPEGHGGYWLNSASVKQDRYEDFVTSDLIADAERGLPADRDRSIAGVSMGGFGALVLALRHPGLYRFAGALSPPVDVPERAFTWRRLAQSVAIRRIFGPYGSAERCERDPFWLVRHTEPTAAPQIYLGAGVEPLRGPVERFSDSLQQRGFRSELHVEPGGHEWRQWNRHLERMLGEIAADR